MIKRKERKRKRERKEARKKLGMNQQEKSKFWLMRMRESKILYNLQQQLVENLV